MLSDADASTTTAFPRSAAPADGMSIDVVGATVSGAALTVTASSTGVFPATDVVNVARYCRYLLSGLAIVFPDNATNGDHAVPFAEVRVSMLSAVPTGV